MKNLKILLVCQNYRHLRGHAQAGMLYTLPDGRLLHPLMLIFLQNFRQFHPISNSHSGCKPFIIFRGNSLR